MSARQAENSRRVTCPECGIPIAVQGNGWGNTTPTPFLRLPAPPPPPRSSNLLHLQIGKTHTEAGLCGAAHVVKSSQVEWLRLGGSSNRETAHVVGSLHVALLRTLARSLRSAAPVSHAHPRPDKLRLGKGTLAVTCRDRAAPFCRRLASLSRISCENFLKSF